MTEPRDEISTWLDAPVEPLAPPPGTYQRIRQRARRRRRHQVAAVCVTAATLAVAVLAAPTLAGALFPSGHSAPVAVGGASATNSSPSPSPSNVLTEPSGPIGNGPPVPNGFAPFSVTFVGLPTGLALGTVAAPCPATGCLALARTDDQGATWYSVPAPQIGRTSPRAAVSQVRFLNRDVGWVFGPQLWWTTDGGQSWQQAGTGGRQVISLEAAGDRAFAVFVTCTAGGGVSGPGQTAACPPTGQSYQLFSAAAGSAAWQPVPGATSGTGTASIVLTEHTGYLVAVNGQTVTLSSGPIGGSGRWHKLATPCPRPPGPQPPTASGALLAAAPGADLFAVCDAVPTTQSPANQGTVGQGAVGQGTVSQGTVSQGGAGQAAKQVVSSADGGHSWQRRALAPIPGAANAAAVTPGGGILVIAASSGLYISADSGISWRLALTGPPGGFGYVGMTDVLQGFAITARPGPGALLMTTDGGQSWQASTISRAP